MRSIAFPRRTHYDAIVVGARVGGAATAMLLARAGLRVLVVDRARYGADTLSTLALMRAGTWQLHRWGLLDSIVAAGTPTIGATTFFYGDDEVRIPISPDGPVAGLYAPRRTVLDPTLADAAAAAGAEVIHGARLVDLQRDRQGRVVGAQLQCGGVTVNPSADVVIGADGMRSTVAKLVDARVYRRGRSASAAIYTFVADLPDDGYQWYFAPGVAAGVIPTNGEMACVFAAMPPERFAREARGAVAWTWRKVLGEANPAIAALVDRGRVRGQFRSFPGLTGFFRTTRGPGWALVGDAGHHNDSLTAHGITAALRDAELLAGAVLDGGYDRYACVRDELSGPIFDATERVASFAWSLEDLQQHHLELSAAFKREAQVVARWAPAGIHHETELAACA